MEEEKRYQRLEEEDNMDAACEPAAGYAATGSGYNTFEGISNYDKIPVGKLAFYTEDPSVFESRITEIETDLERAEQGDESAWLTAEEFDVELKKEFPWLR